jgi:hypothetical protein
VADWPWLFLTNAPVALLAVALAVKGLPATARNVRAFDATAALLCAALFACLLFAIAGFAHLGWRPAAAALAASALCGYALHRREAGRTAPILALDLFRIPLFSLSAATSLCAFAIQGLVFVVLPFLFRFELGYSQVEAGYLITPWPATLAFMTLIAAPLANRIAPGILGCVGLVLVGAGLVTAGDAAAVGRRVRHRLAAGGVRCRLRLLPVAQHGGDDEERAGRPQRRRGRHPGRVAPAGSGHRRGHGGVLPVGVAGRRDHDGAVARDGAGGVRQCGEPCADRAVGAGAVTRGSSPA